MFIFVVNLYHGDAKVLEVKYSDQWNSDDFVQKDFFPHENGGSSADKVIPKLFLKLQLEELLKNNAVLREQIGGVLNNKENMRQQDLVAAIWNIIFSPWIVPSSTTTEATTTTTASSSSGSDSFSSPTPTSIKINRTRRTTKYQIRGYCKNPPKKHLPENEIRFDL